MSIGRNVAPGSDDGQVDVGQVGRPSSGTGGFRRSIGIGMGPSLMIRTRSTPSTGRPASTPVEKWRNRRDSAWRFHRSCLQASPRPPRWRLECPDFSCCLLAELVENALGFLKGNVLVHLGGGAWRCFGEGEGRLFNSSRVFCTTQGFLRLAELMELR